MEQLNQDMNLCLLLLKEITTKLAKPAKPAEAIVKYCGLIDTVQGKCQRVTVSKMYLRLSYDEIQDKKDSCSEKIGVNSVEVTC